jgi:hypothetical protein
MSSSNERDWYWTEQDAKDAQRLLQRLDERSKRRAGQTPAEIQGSCVSLQEGCPEASRVGVAQTSGHQPLAKEGHGSGLVGRAAYIDQSFVANGCARPSQDEATGSTDRTECAPGEL